MEPDRFVILLAVLALRAAVAEMRPGALRGSTTPSGWNRRREPRGRLPATRSRGNGADDRRVEPCGGPLPHPDCGSLFTVFSADAAAALLSERTQVTQPPEVRDHESRAMAESRGRRSSCPAC
jgi:hypothetical protein